MKTICYLCHLICLVNPLLLVASIYFHYCKHGDIIRHGPKRAGTIFCYKKHNSYFFFILYHLIYILQQVKEHILYSWRVKHSTVVKPLSFYLFNLVLILSTYISGFPGGVSGKESTCQRRILKRHGFNSWSGRSSEGGHDNPLQYSGVSSILQYPGESHGQRSLAGYSPQHHEESDMTEVTQHTCTHGIFHCFKHKILYLAIIRYKELLLVYARNTLRRSSGSQNLRRKHYNLFTFCNYNEFNNWVSSFSLLFFKIIIPIFLLS